MLLVATRGLTAGSGFATPELRLILHEAMVIAGGRWPYVQLILYVDDLTIAASGALNPAVSDVADATDYFVSFFEDSLELEVSPTKSFAVASKHSVAIRVSRKTHRRILQPKRAVKLLGTLYAGGRLRAVGVLKQRLKAFRQRTPRIHAVRRQRIDPVQVVRAMGAPGML